MQIFNDLNENLEPDYTGLTEEEEHKARMERKVQYAKALRLAILRVKKSDRKATYFRPHVARMKRWILHYLYLPGSYVEMLRVINTNLPKDIYSIDTKYIEEGKQSSTYLGQSNTVSKHKYQHVDF